MLTVLRCAKALLFLLVVVFSSVLHAQREIVAYGAMPARILPADSIQKNLDVVSAKFYQPEDSLYTTIDDRYRRSFFSGGLWNSNTRKNRVTIGYSVRPFIDSVSINFRIIEETTKMLEDIPLANQVARDSIFETECNRLITFRRTQNKLRHEAIPCYDSANVFFNLPQLDKHLLNADSVIMLRFVNPTTVSCAVGLSKEVIIYKRRVGYLVLHYNLFHEANRKISFEEASDLLDEFIEKTWGMIRFKNGQPGREK
ncbi:hypothetical protein [Niabella beijingensis]|uniref:hypothetical protein n=1 Tax=Niabella beijingensis TaxID=2872700 RepID=UPI001CBB36CC|nr:hypothetical protein [Niabella beijingensis]MBZ4190588.1 hypothetical protein [Niabella beijingensis]